MERKHELAKCEECEWKEQPYAGASGPENANILVIGEAPGRVEAETGTPFTGPSGKLLDKVLAHHRLRRDSIRFTNVAACAPPRISSSSPTAPPKNVIRCCSGRLRAELDKRESVLLLGNTAKEAVLGTREPITRVRQGPPRYLPEFDNTRFIASIHPAACLRQSDSFPSLVRDVGKIRSNVYVKWEPPKHAVFDEPERATEALRQLARRDGVLTVDIEVGVDKDSAFSHPDTLLCVGIGFSPGNRAAVIGEKALGNPTVRAALAIVLNTKQIVCHNGKFDLQVLMRLGLTDHPNLYADTMLASYVLDERPGQHGLKGLASEILGAPNYAAEIGKYIRKNDSYALVPRPVLYRYNAYDAALTYNLWRHFEQRLERDNLRHVHDDLVRYSNELIYLELDGVAVDPAHADRLTGEFVERLTELEERLSRWVANPRSPKQVMEAMNDLGVRAPDTREETLTALYERSPARTARRAFFGLMLRHRKEQKLYGTYVKGTRKRLVDGRVFPTYLLHGTVSGRLACRNPNLQNVSRDSSIRRLFVPTMGNTFVQGDYSQAELRVIATYAEDEYLREVFRNGERDIHSEVARRFYGPDFTKEQRVRAKAVVFGLAYGREAPSIAQEHGISLQEAEDFIRTFFSLIPGVVEWRKRVREQIFDRGQALQTSFGRKRRFWLITRENKMDVEKEGLSFLPQSTASDICLNALVRLRQSFGTSVGAPRIRIPVHDSILVECATSDARDVAQLMEEIMEQTAEDVFTDYVPFPVDIAMGDSWGTLEEVNL